MKFKVIAENGAEKELEIGNSTLKELRLFLKENQLQEDVFDIDIKKDCFYYTIDNCGDVCKHQWFNCGYDNDCVKVANACKDKELMEKRALNETLDRLMWRFSMQNGGREIDWEVNSLTDKYYVFFDVEECWLCVDTNDSFNTFGAIYFKDRETAERCIEEVIKPFLEEHPDFEPNVY